MGYTAASPSLPPAARGALVAHSALAIGVAASGHDPDTGFRFLGLGASLLACHYGAQAQAGAQNHHRFGAAPTAAPGIPIPSGLQITQPARSLTARAARAMPESPAADFAFLNASPARAIPRRSAGNGALHLAA